MLVYDLLKVGNPNDIALRYKGQNITYERLNQIVEIFKDYFYSLGIRENQNVGLFYKNSPEFIYSYFAIASLGAVVVPFNLLLTPRELTYIVSDAKIKHIITMKELELTGDVTQIVLPNVMESLEGLKLDKAPVVDKKEEDECVIIYTSGTTGTPKGAMLTNKNLVSNADSSAEFLKIIRNDNALCVLPMFHSFAWTVAVLAQLVRGGCITILETFMPKEAIKTIIEQNISLVHGVPAMYNFYLQIGTKEEFNSVRLFLSGGAALPVEVLNQFEEKIGKVILEGYGLSEASPVVSINPLDKIKPGSIGKALPKVEIKIANEKNEEAPRGEIGELIVKGPNVMKGYLNLEKATSEAIIDGWLHTGDLAYMDDEGYVFIVDRLKDMIIVGGLNVYSREVEEIIYKHKTIRECAVIGLPDKTAGEKVCTFIVLKEGMQYDKKEFMDFLRENLASYKVPKVVYVLDILPKNATGKIAKKELREKYLEI